MVSDGKCKVKVVKKYLKNKQSCNKYSKNKKSMKSLSDTKEEEQKFDEMSTLQLLSIATTIAPLNFKNSNMCITWKSWKN